MKIITFNLPQQSLDLIDSLTGKNGIYPSRSELIRIAVREYLIKENQALQGFSSLANGLNAHRIHLEGDKNNLGKFSSGRDVPLEFT
jgi:Arc/MetJ-type ribon-helix-helix transcriptional regulator